MTERLVVAGLLLLAPLVLLLVGRAGEFSDLAAFSPMFFPSRVLWCWVLVAALSFAGELLRLRAAVPGDSRGVDRAAALRIGLVVVAMAGFVFALTELGFVISGAAFGVFALRVLGIRSVPLLLGYGIGVPVALFALFNHGLGLPLPTSPFSYLF